MGASQPQSCSLKRFPPMRLQRFHSLGPMKTLPLSGKATESSTAVGAG